MTTQCPHCKGKDLYKNTAQDSSGWGIGFKKTVMVTDYVCGSCGIVQKFVEDPTHREGIRQHWTKVNP